MCNPMQGLYFAIPVPYVPVWWLQRCTGRTLVIYTYARATLAKRPFVVNPTFVKFDRNLLNLGQIWLEFNRISPNMTNI